MAIELLYIDQLVDRSVYKAIHDTVYSFGFGVNKFDETRYPDDDTGLANLETDMAAIRTSKGFVIETFGAGSNRAKYEKKVPRIVYTPKRNLPGDLGGNQGVYYSLTAEGDYQAEAQPPLVSDRQFEVAIVAATVEQLHTMNALISAVLSKRSYIQLYDDETQEFFVVNTTYREYPDTEFGILEHIYGYEARDLWDRIEYKDELVSPLKEITLETYLGDNEDPDETLTISSD